MRASADSKLLDARRAQVAGEQGGGGAVGAAHVEDRDHVAPQLGEAADGFGELVNMLSGNFKNAWVADGNQMAGQVPCRETCHPCDQRFRRTHLRRDLAPGT